MTLTEVQFLRRKLNQLACYGESSVRELNSYAEKIKDVGSFIEHKKPKDSYSLQLSYGQLLESQGYLESWINHPKKKTMDSTFREYKRDFISVLDDYIKCGETYNLWENV